MKRWEFKEVSDYTNNDTFQALIGETSEFASSLGKEWQAFEESQRNKENTATLEKGNHGPSDDNHSSPSASSQSPEMNVDQVESLREETAKSIFDRADDKCEEAAEKYRHKLFGTSPDIEKNEWEIAYFFDHLRGIVKSKLITEPGLSPYYDELLPNSESTHQVI